MWRYLMFALFWMWNLLCGNLRYFSRNLFCCDLIAFTWKKWAKNYEGGEKMKNMRCGNLPDNSTRDICFVRGRVFISFWHNFLSKVSAIWGISWRSFNEGNVAKMVASKDTIENYGWVKASSHLPHTFLNPFCFLLKLFFFRSSYLDYFWWKVEMNITFTISGKALAANNIWCATSTYQLKIQDWHLTLLSRRKSNSKTLSAEMCIIWIWRWWLL